MTSTDTPLLQTPLFGLHQSLGARMVPFAGYTMPVQYDGVKAEHLHTRQHAGLFDVSHMGQILVSGIEAATLLESLLPVDLVDLPVNRQSYALFTNARGGIRDDLMICRWRKDCFLLVVNAACKEQDMAWLKENLAGLEIDTLEDQALIALQGPGSIAVLSDLMPEVAALSFMQGCHCSIGNAKAWVTRSGYTGEDGFEISLPATAAAGFAEQLLAIDAVKPAGLGARDTLRLEAGLCLYGHDLNENTTPVSAALHWSISRARRKGGAREGGFPGADTILAEMENGTVDKRVGLTVNSRAPVREGAELVDNRSYLIGRVSSGGFGPSVDGPIAMGYVQAAFAEPGTQIHAMVRGKPLPVTVTPLPFIPHRYFR